MHKLRILLACLAFIAIHSIACAQLKKANWQNQNYYKKYQSALQALQKEDFERSLIISRELLEQAFLSQDDKATGYAYNLIAANFDSLGDSEKALFYYEKALLFALKIQDYNLLKWTYNNIGNNYCFDQKDYNKGIEFYKESLIYSYKTKDTTQLVLTKLNIAWAYFDIKNFQKGKSALNFASRHHSKFGGSNTITTLKLLNGIYAAENNDTLIAKIYFKRAIEEAQKNNEDHNLSIAYQEFSKYLNKNKQYKKAYYFLNKHDSINESISLNSKLNKSKITDINLEIDEYKRELDKLEALYHNKEELLAYEKTRNKRIIGIMISLFVITIILFYFFFQNAKLKQKNKLKDEQRKIQNNLINATIDGQESERIQIAGFLHDNISAMLSSAGLHLKTINTDNTPYAEEIIKTKTILEEAHDRIRDLSHQLLPTLLVRFGLFYAIEDLCEKNSNSSIHFQYSSSINPKTRFNDKFEMRLYFIISELLNNICKHSFASQAQVKLDMEYHELIIEIKDNGKGFDTKKLIIVEGFGINQIRARIKNMNGIFKIISKKNYGTTIKMSVPALYS